MVCVQECSRNSRFFQLISSRRLMSCSAFHLKELDMQMFMFNLGMWQVGRNQELCNFFHVSIYKVVTVHSDFLSMQAAVQLLIGLCIIILETVVFWVFVLTFLFYSLSL